MTPKFGEVLKLFRVNMRELKKKDDYQVSSDRGPGHCRAGPLRTRTDVRLHA